jgi:hypothetical protein
VSEEEKQEIFFAPNLLLLVELLHSYLAFAWV